MVKARTDFLEKDYYDFMRQYVKEKVKGNVYLDAGCGQGYYTKEIGANFEQSYGIDMPFSDESIDCVTSIFVPLGQDEIYRILKENGYWIVVGPGPKHCFELKEVLYDTPYENEMPEIQEQYDMVSQKIIKETKMVDDVWALLEMTPYRYKTSQAGLDRVKKLERLEVTFEFVVTVYKKI